MDGAGTATSNMGTGYADAILPPISSDLQLLPQQGTFPLPNMEAALIIH